VEAERKRFAADPAFETVNELRLLFKDVRKDMKDLIRVVRTILNVGVSTSRRNARFSLTGHCRSLFFRNILVTNSLLRSIRTVSVLVE
jgi:hypothetical protein